MRKNSFTLLEILIVIGIIAILAALTVGGIQFAGDKSDEAKTRAVMKEFEMALEKYKKDKGTYPIVAAGEINLGNDKWKTFKAGKYLGGDNSGLIVDGYGNPLYYCYPGTKNKGKYDLWSKGPDDKHGSDGDIDNRGAEGSDDICNWRQ